VQTLSADVVVALLLIVPGKSLLRPVARARGFLGEPSTLEHLKSQACLLQSLSFFVDVVLSWVLSVVPSVSVDAASILLIVLGKSLLKHVAGHSLALVAFQVILNPRT
jgi:hypothetical protein